MGSVRQENIAKEARALDKLCHPDQGRTLVCVFHHEQGTGGLLAIDLYQIDIELCLWNMQDEFRNETVSVRARLIQCYITIISCRLCYNLTSRKLLRFYTKLQKGCNSFIRSKKFTEISSQRTVLLLIKCSECSSRFCD